MNAERTTANTPGLNTGDATRPTRPKKGWGTPDKEIDLDARIKDPTQAKPACVGTRQDQEQWIADRI